MFLVENMTGVYTEATLKAMNKTLLIDLFSKNARSEEFHYRHFDGKNKRSE